MILNPTANSIYQAVKQGADTTAKISEVSGILQANISYHLIKLRDAGLVRNPDGDIRRYEAIPGADENIESQPQRAPASPRSDTVKPVSSIEKLLGKLKLLHDELESEFIALSMHVITPKEKEEFERLKKQDEAIQAMVKKR